MTWPALSDVRGRVRSILGEPVAGFWTDAELNRLINAGCVDVASKTLCIENIDTLSVSARTVTVSGLLVLAVEDATLKVGLQKISPKMIGHLPLSGGTVSKYWFTWWNAGTAKLVVDPPPTSDSLKAYVADFPAELTGESDTLGNTAGLPLEAHELVVEYAVYMALLKAQKFNMAGKIYMTYIEKTQQIRGLYERRRADMRMELAIPERIVMEGEK